MKKTVIALALVLLFAVPVTGFADQSKSEIKIFSVQLINNHDRNGVKGFDEREMKIAELQKKIWLVLNNYPNAEVTMMQSSGKFFTQITAVVQY